MKYYGVRRIIQQEDHRYALQKTHARIKAIIPGKGKELREEWYKEQYTSDGISQQRIREIEDSSIPVGKECCLYCIVTSDLIRREDIADLQKGIRKLLKEHRSSKFLGIQHDSPEQIEKKINNMDSTLTQYYDSVECGMFDFAGSAFQQEFHHYSIRIRNINVSYLAIEFEVYLSEDKLNELSRLIKSDYHDSRGYPMKYLIGKKNRGSSIGYTVTHYYDPALKADKIFEFLTFAQWEFYDALKKNIPFLLHGMGLMPPRIDVFKTDIDYHEDYHVFWDSIAVSKWYGQFVDENHKFFFQLSLSGRYEETGMIPRLIYIYRENGKTRYEHIDVDYEVYSIIREYGSAFFTIMFSNVLADYTSERVVKYKHIVNRIKLKRNQLHRLLKSRYEYERDIDLFMRYAKDEPWKKASQKLKELFSENDIATQHRIDLMIGWKSFYKGCLAVEKKLTSDIKLLIDEYEEKQVILQHLFDYRNVRITWTIGILTLVVALLTLIVSIDPNHGKCFIEWTKNLFIK